jgi:hypothetical protein
MGIRKVIDNLKILSINTEMVNQASFGDINLYDNKKTIKYPYVNIDVLTSFVRNYSKKYKFRIYVCDRNDPYTAYNKAELILDSILKNVEIDIAQYTTNYFIYNFQDQVHGVYADVDIEEKLLTDCSIVEVGDVGYILQENGDLIALDV